MQLERIRLERQRGFGDVWLGWRLWRTLGLDTVCRELMAASRGEVAWSAMAAVLVIARLCEPSSELHIAEDRYRRTALDRKRVEEVFGWLKTVGLLRKVQYRGVDLVDWIFRFGLAAYNLVRTRNLTMAAAR